MDVDFWKIGKSMVFSFLKEECRVILKECCIHFESACILGEGCVRRFKITSFGIVSFGSFTHSFSFTRFQRI